MRLSLSPALALVVTLATGCTTAGGETAPAVSLAGQDMPPTYVASPAASASVAAVPPAPVIQSGGLANFGQCAARLRDRAVASGIPQPVVQQAFAQLRPNPRVVELDRRQPEFVQTFWQYFDARINANRIERGRTMLAQHRPLLQQLEARYGVPGRYLVSFWGLESNFGENMGGFHVVESLATLACEGRRAQFFETELMNALQIAAQGDAAVSRMQGSWAGAMGQPQFMPSTFLRHAVDGNGDGRRDIWGNVPDALASASNFLRAIGWRPGEEWGQEVVLPTGFDYRQASLTVERPVSEWQQSGIRSADGRPLPGDGRLASIVVPGGYRGPAFIVYQNFRAILNWNRSINYAVAVGHLADRLAGGGPLVAQRSLEDQPLSREDVMEIQTRLVAVGEDAGEADGVVGTRTREAIRGFQARLGRPADGHPDQDLLWQLRRAMGS